MKLDAIVGPDRRRFVEAARDAVEAEIVRVKLERPEFRWSTVSLLPVGITRSKSLLAIAFTRDSERGRNYRYWTYIWEQVAWDKEYRPPPTDPPGLGWVNNFVLEMDNQLDDPATFRRATPPDENGVRWIRALLAWA